MNGKPPVRGRKSCEFYKHNRQFLDAERGVYSMELFDYPVLAQPLPRGWRKSKGLFTGTHAVVIVGYELVPGTNQVRKWKIQNSWGSDAGDKGFYHMYHDYFRNFAISIAFSDITGKLIPAYEKTQPSQLDFGF